MREIKFRAWDKKINTWVLGRYGFHIMGEFEEWDNIIIEQWTGLTDKNGRDIYEGDIIQIDELNWKGRVVFHYASFMLIDNKSGFHHPIWSKCAVIGNIHENPTLLKGKTEDDE